MNPGTSNPIWRRIADTGGWVQNTGTFSLVGSWPSTLPSGPTAGTSYEIFKVYRPEAWLQAINYALTKAYPKRHRQLGFEVPQNLNTRIIDYGHMAKQTNVLTNPTTSLTVTELADGTGLFQPGVYTFTYTLYNNFGETKQAPTTTLTITGTDSRVDIAQITNVPAGAMGANYYSSFQPGDTTLDLINLSDESIVVPAGASDQNLPAGSSTMAGLNINGTIWEVKVSGPNPYFGVTPPSYNTTNVDFFRLHQIQQRINPGSTPEIWNSIDPKLYKHLGGTVIQLLYRPSGSFNLRFLLTTTLSTLSADTDTTPEPTEMIMEGAEAYLWALLSKTSTIVNVNWQKLHDISWANYLAHLNQYAMNIPRDFVYIPIIKSQY